MDSFYGGRPGFSFIIVANYASIDEMVENFQQGPSYEAVHFDEHVLINTENKNDPDNGKIYRRGYDYMNDLGGAIYVGTIVGPAGKAPMLEFTSLAKVQAMQETEGYDYRYSEGSYTVENSDLVPGADGEGNYNDEIQWACCSVRDENGEDCIAYIGFIIPYLVVDFTAESVDAYYNRSDDTNDFVNQNLSERTDDGSHTFYEKWHFSIPKGIKGESLNNFRVMVADDTIEEYDGQDDDIENSRQVLVYDYYNYDNNETGDPVSIYLGDYNMIDNIALDEEGTVTITYSHDDVVTYENLFKWIEEVTLDTTNGHFTVKYNYGADDEESTTYETDLVWVSGIDISQSGVVTVSYINGTSETLDTVLNFILEMTITDDYHLIVYYSNPEVRAAIVEAGTNYANYGDGDWLDLGSVKEENGILIGLNLSLTDYPDLEDITTAVAWLNSAYPNGLTGTNLKGKVVTIGDDDDTKLFYAFDYTITNGSYAGWYYLGTWESDASTLFMVSTEDASDDLSSKQTALSVSGLWFVVEE